jgi:hypothetical protein
MPIAASLIGDEIKGNVYILLTIDADARAENGKWGRVMKDYFQEKIQEKSKRKVRT